MDKERKNPKETCKVRGGGKKNQDELNCGMRKSRK